MGSILGDIWAAKNRNRLPDPIPCNRKRAMAHRGLSLKRSKEAVPCCVERQIRHVRNLRLAVYDCQLEPNNLW